MMFVTGMLHKLEDLAVRAAPLSLVSLVLRCGLAVPFFKSGLTKWDGFLRISDTPKLLFENEFKLHILGRVYDYPYPTLMAWASSLGEVVFPVLLVAGFFTRLSAVALLVMTLMIQLTIPEGWANFHLPWAAMALAIIVIGPGRISLDWIVRRRA